MFDIVSFSNEKKSKTYRDYPSGNIGTLHHLFDNADIGATNPIQRMGLEASSNSQDSVLYVRIPRGETEHGETGY